MKKTKLSKRSAESRILAYILTTERDNYITWCEENGWKTSSIMGKNQIKHIYALALIALGLEFDKGIT